jgi:signal transduction histidine kinase
VSSDWTLSLIVMGLLSLVWPFHIDLTEDVEIYLPGMWTSAAAAYILGPAVLPVYWMSTTLGFVLIVVLDGMGLVRATGITGETVRQVRRQPFPEATGVDGHLRGFLDISMHVVRVAVLALFAVLAPGRSLLTVVLVGEAAVALWLAVVPIPGRMAPRRGWARFSATLGRDMLFATELLQVAMVCFLLLAYHHGGAPGLIAASLSTLILHAILKRLNDTRIESERRRRELLDMRDALDRRERLAAIGQTASTVFHQVARHHGAIGMFAHLLTRGSTDPEPEDWARTVHECAERISASVEDANRVIDELLRFGQDRALNLYPQSLTALIEECVTDCRTRADAGRVRVEVTALADTTVVLDKHKIRQALGNLLDNAIEVTEAGGRVEVEATSNDARVRITVRDFGAGVAEEIRARLFTPFCTTKLDGIGLGLALAKELVEAHGGRIEWSPLEPGTIFILTLPVTPPAAA